MFYFSVIEIEIRKLTVKNKRKRMKSPILYLSMSSEEQPETEPIPTWQDVAMLMGYFLSILYFTFTNLSLL